MVDSVDNDVDIFRDIFGFKTSSEVVFDFKQDLREFVSLPFDGQHHVRAVHVHQRGRCRESECRIGVFAGVKNLTHIASLSIATGRTLIVIWVRKDV